MIDSPQILVVDDDQAVAESIRDGLLASGYQVPALAATKAEAIRLAGQLRPGLVLMDIILKDG
jgi:CheY-like chemotaxis protein